MLGLLHSRLGFVMYLATAKRLHGEADAQEARSQNSKTERFWLLASEMWGDRPVVKRRCTKTIWPVGPPLRKGEVMPATVRCGLIQATCTTSTQESLERIKQESIEKHLKFIAEAAGKGVKILCMQEIFTGPYFCAEQSTRWYGMVEKIPDGPTINLMQEVAKKHGDGPDRSDLRRRNDRRLLQHGGRHRCRWHLSWQISETSYSACRSRFLGKVLFQAG